MSVSYQELKRLRPASLQQASAALSGAVTTLATEHSQYQSRVVHPLKARHGWHGGGRPDAAAVAEINGLAIDTTRLRAAAGAAAYMYAAAGFAVAQTYLAAVEKQISDDDMTVADDGSVSTTYVPVGDDNSYASPSATALRYQQKIATIVAFATAVDSHAAHTLNTSHEPPVTTLTNRPGLLGRARADHANAAQDAAHAIAEIKRLGDQAAHDLPSLTDLLPDLPTYDVQIPPGAPACAWLGAALLAIGLNGVEWGAIGAVVTAIPSDGTGALAGAGVTAGGALLASLGVILLTAGGIGFSQTDITRTSDNGNSGPSKNLDDLTQQARQLENQAEPGYGEHLVQKPGTDEYIDAREAAGRIVNGHAYPKHVVEQGEFRGVHNRHELAEVVEQTIEKGEPKRLSAHRTGFWYKGVFVSVDESTADGGTVFVPRAGRAYFDGLSEYSAP